MLKNKGFSLAEILVALVVIGVITASAMPLMTKMAQNKTGVDRNTIICISESPAEWYKEIDGTTEIPAEGTKCWAAVVDTQHNRGRALETAKWYANNAKTELQKITAKKLLRTACDNGGKEACDYFIYSCWKSGSDSEPYCDDEANFLDLTYYLHQYTDVTPGGIYIKKEMEGLLTKNITNLLEEVKHSCSNNQKPEPAPENLGDNIACDLLDLNIAWWIKQCNSGNAFACKYCYDNNYNRSCTRVKSLWDEADSGIYRLTAKGDPAESGNTPVEVNCNMTNLASAAISGCNFLVSGDCEEGYDKQYNRSCYEVKTEWGGAETGDYKLTANGDPGAPGNEPTIEVYCNMTSKVSAAITGCGYNTAAEGPIPADEYVPGDCAYAYTEKYNRDCDKIFAVWSSAPMGDYYHLTGAGDSPPHLVSSVCLSEPPDDPVNTCFNPRGATTDFLYTETGFDYSFRMTNCNIAKDPVANDVTPDSSEKCWYGKTGTTCTDSGCGNDAGGGKTDKYLCNYPGAIAACHALNGANPVQYGEGCSDGKCTKNSTGWRLPTSYELARLRLDPLKNSNLTTKAFNNPGLCDQYSGYRSPQCMYYEGCTGSFISNCYPNVLLVSDSPNQGMHFYLQGDMWKANDGHPPTYALSVRCVRSL